MAKKSAADLKKAGAVRLQKKEKGGTARITLPKGHKDIKKYMKQGYKQIPIESVEGDLGKTPALDEGKTILANDIKGVKSISDIEVRFNDETEWKKMSALVKKELKKPAYKSLPKPYFSPDPLQFGFGDPDGKLGIDIKPIVDMIVKQSKDPHTRIKSLSEGYQGQLKRGTDPKYKGQLKKNQMTSGQKKQFDTLYKKMDGGKEHMAIKKKIKNQVKADDTFHSLVMKKVMGEEHDADLYVDNTKKNKELVGSYKDEKGNKITIKVEEEIAEGKVSDSIIQKDFPNVWAASARDRTILKKFHTKVDTSNYKKQKLIYKKNIKAFVTDLQKEKLSSIMKKMTVKKGPMKGWMTDEVIRVINQGQYYVQETSLDEINLNMPEKVRVQLLTLYNKAMDVPYGSPAFKGIKRQIDKINDKYSVKNESEVTRAKEIADLKDKHKREIEKEKEDVKAIQKDEQLVGKKVIPFFDTYRNMQEEVMDITVDPKNKLPKTDQQNKIAQNIYNLAKTYNAKVAMVGKHLRFKGTKGDMNSIGRAVIGKSSMGNATGTDMTTPQIDKMLNKNLK